VKSPTNGSMIVAAIVIVMLGAAGVVWRLLANQVAGA
jgi:hypothetical protein